MVARIVCGKSIRGILNYNENKVQNAEAKLLLAAGFPKDPNDLSFKNKLERFEMRTRQNVMTKTNALHITLNFSPQEVIDDNMMQAIAFDYMRGIGFSEQPFLLYRHYDTAHPHCHIATVNIANGGQRIETHNLGRNQSEKTRKEIEITYGLVKAEDQKSEMEYLLRPATLERAQYGKRETKATISAIVREVVGTYKFTSLPELNVALRQFNVIAHPGMEGTMMKEKGGLVYCILDDQGQAVGIPIKASSIYSAPTLKNLALKYKPNETERKPYALRLKHLLDKALSAAKNMQEIENSLRSQGIRLLLRRNVQGEIYGLTFIDNGTRCVFNGSDLGKAYSAKAFMERLEKAGFAEQLITMPPPMSPGEIPTERNAGEKKMSAAETEFKPKYPAQEQSVIEMLWDTALSDRYEESIPNPFRRKRRNLGLE